MNTPNRESPKHSANRTAVRYLFYWSLGIAVSLGVDMFRRGVVATNGIPMAVALIVAVLSGAAYFRGTNRDERRRDAAKKISDPFYE